MYKGNPTKVTSRGGDNDVRCCLQRRKMSLHFSANGYLVRCSLEDEGRCPCVDDACLDGRG